MEIALNVAQLLAITGGFIVLIFKAGVHYRGLLEESQELRRQIISRLEKLEERVFNDS